MTIETLQRWIELLRNANRSVSKWDESRTDRDVFVRRTLDKWYSGKYFQVKEKDWKANKDKYFIRTCYVYVIDIRFVFGWSDKIAITFVFPYSFKIEERTLDMGDLFNIEFVENEVDFRIIQKFYPIVQLDKPDPFADLRARLKNPAP